MVGQCLPSIFLSVFHPSVLQSIQTPVNVFRFRHYCTLLTDTDVLSSLWKPWLPDCLTAWLRAACLSAFACELQITAQQYQACSRQRQGFTLSSAPRSCLWVLCHMTLTEIDPLPTSRSCCATQSFIWCRNHHLKDKKRSSPLSMCNWVTMTWSPAFLNFISFTSKNYILSDLSDCHFCHILQKNPCIPTWHCVHEFNHNQCSLASHDLKKRNQQFIQ